MYLYHRCVGAAFKKLVAFLQLAACHLYPRFYCVVFLARKLFSLWTSLHSKSGRLVNPRASEFPKSSWYSRWRFNFPLSQSKAICLRCYIRICGKLDKVFDFSPSKFLSPRAIFSYFESFRKCQESTGFCYFGSEILLKRKWKKIVKLLKWICLLV